EGAGELLPQVLRTRVTMRLKEHQQTVELAAAGSFERGFDFNRVMAVIVDHGDVVDRAFGVEAAADSAQLREALAYQLCRNVEVKRDRCRGSRIADVMDPGRMGQAEQPEVFAFIGEAKFAGESMELNVADKQVGLAGGAVGKDGALDVCDDCLDVRLVETQD